LLINNQAIFFQFQ